MWNRYLWENKEMDAFNSTLAITFSLMAVIFSAKIFTERFFDISLPSPFDNLYSSIGFIAVLFLIHYFLFEKSNKYLEIENKFLSKKESKSSWLLKGFLVFLYVIGSIVVYIFLI